MSNHIPKLSEFYANIKTHLQEKGFTVSKGEFWTPADSKSFEGFLHTHGTNNVAHNLYMMAFSHHSMDKAAAAQVAPVESDANDSEVAEPVLTPVTTGPTAEELAATQAQEQKEADDLASAQQTQLAAQKAIDDAAAQKVIDDQAALDAKLNPPDVDTTPDTSTSTDTEQE